jgi:hypothetical protein
MEPIQMHRRRPIEEKTCSPALSCPAFGALSPGDQQWTPREAVVLRHWHGFSLVEISECLGCTTAAVTGLLHRGLRNLRKLLHDLE